MYEEAFYLTGERGNNAFAFSARGREPSLYVPSVREGSLSEVREGEHVVFEDFDDEGVLQSCRGLEHFIRSEWQGIPVVVVDNHNHVFYFWYEAAERGLLERGATVVHIDAHKDARVPEVLFEGGTLEDVFRYTNEVLNVGNYIVPAQKEGLVGEVQFVTSEAALEDRHLLTSRNKILNIDLDFFAPDMDYIPFEKVKSFILEQAKTAKLITVSTSPFFIDQGRAFRALSNLFFVE